MKINKDVDVLVIVGPTSVGKSELAIELAQKYNGEIISGDAYQVYKKMDIGTAKVSAEEQALAKHHLINIVDYQEEYNVKLFQKAARKLISEIKARGKLPIIAGGTGLYIQAVLHEYEFNEVDGFEQVKTEVETHTKGELIEYVNQNNIVLNESDIQNYKRLVMTVTKHKLGLPIANKAREKYYQNYQIIGLTTDRQVLYERINMRVDKMIAMGLIDEVKQFDAGYLSQLAIGYKEIHQYLAGEISKEEAIELVKKNSRNFAKRQYTWYRNKMPEIEWYEKRGDKWELIKN